MEKQSQKRNLYLIPLAYHQLFFSRHKNDPLLDFKVYSKEQFLEKLTFEINDQLILEIVKRREVSFEIAKIYANNLRFIDDKVEPSTSKIAFLKHLKEELITAKIFKDNYYDLYEVKNREIILHPLYQEDQEILSLLKKYNLQYVVEKEVSQEIRLGVTSFLTIEDEVRNLFLQLSSRYQKSQTLENLFILADQSYYLLLKKFAKAYNIPLNFPNYQTLNETLLGIKLLEEFSQNGDLEAVADNLKTKIKEDEYNYLRQVLSRFFAVNNLGLTKIQQSEFLKIILQDIKLLSPDYENGVTVLQSLSFEEGEVFILGFENGKYPVIAKDEDYLSDHEKKSLGMVSSSQENLFKSRLLIDYLTKQRVTLSYKELDITGSFYPSPLVKQLKMTVWQNVFPEIFYSYEDVSFLLAEQLDEQRIFDISHPHLNSLKKLVDIPYLAYDNQYTYVDVYHKEDQINLSYSGIKIFYQCQFYYYLEKVLKISDFHGNLATDLGTIVHRLLEASEKDGFNLSQGVSDILKEISDPKLLVFAEKMLAHASNVYTFNTQAKAKMEQPIILREKEAFYQINDKASLHGYIDKIVITGDKQQYYSLIDYKSGSEDFKKDEVQFGYSLQLPIYALLSSTISELKNKQLIGFYIQPTFAKDCVSNSENGYFDGQYLLNGLTINDQEMAATFNGPLSQNPYIYNYKLDKNNTLSSYARLASKEELEDYLSLALNKVQEAEKLIRQNDFRINPKLVKSRDLPCKYCPYEDICFYQKKDIEVKFVEEEEKEESNDELDS